MGQLLLYCSVSDIVNLSVCVSVSSWIVNEVARLAAFLRQKPQRYSVLRIFFFSDETKTVKVDSSVACLGLILVSASYCFPNSLRPVRVSWEPLEWMLISVTQGTERSIDEP